MRVPSSFTTLFSPQQSVHERYADSHQRKCWRILGDHSFKVFRVPDAELTVDQALSVNMKLEAGAVTEEGKRLSNTPVRGVVSVLK